MWDKNNISCPFNMISSERGTGVAHLSSICLTSQQPSIPLTVVSFWTNSVNREWVALSCAGFLPFPRVDSSQWWWGIERSHPQPLLWGVSQGLLFSPFLFNIYMKLLGELICCHGTRYHQYAWWYSIILLFPWRVKQCCRWLILVVGGYEGLDGE